MLENLEHFWKQIGEIGPAALASIILVGFNLLLRRTPDIRNSWIPWLSVALGVVLFPWYMAELTDFHTPLSKSTGLGFIAGLGAAFGYNAIIRAAEKRWPWLHDLLNAEEKQIYEKNTESNRGDGGAGPSDRLPPN